MKNKPLFSTFFACVLLIVLARTAAAQTNLDIKTIKNEQLLNILKLPENLTITHSPNPAFASPQKNPRYPYFWAYTTTVTPKIAGLTVVEFGGFIYMRGKWRSANDIGKAFNAMQFKQWYGAPSGAVLIAGENYADPKNHTIAAKLQKKIALWYFIAKGKDGKKHQGHAVILCAPLLNQPHENTSPSEKKVK